MFEEEQAAVGLVVLMMNVQSVQLVDLKPSSKIETSFSCTFSQALPLSLDTVSDDPG